MDVIKGKSYKSEEIDDCKSSSEHVFFVTLKNFKRGGGFRSDAVKYYSGKYSTAQVVSGGSLVLAVTDMTQERVVIGRVARIPRKSIAKGIISCDVVKLDPKNISPSFLYAILRFSSFSDSLKEFANGANVLHLKPNLVSKQNLILPSKSLRDRFDLVFQPQLNKMDTLLNSIELLSRSRDRLLSRLMSGKIDLEHLDIQFPPSMREEEPAHA